MNVMRCLLKKVTGILVCLTVVLLGSVSSADAAPKWLYRTCQIAAAAGHSYDLGSTMYCIGAGVCHESNPIYGKVTGPLKFSLIKGTVAASSIVAMDKMAEYYPKKGQNLATIFNCASGVGFFLVGRHNVNIVKAYGR